MDFALIMFILLLLTGGIAVWDLFFGAPKRRHAVEQLKQAKKPSRAEFEKAEKQPLLVEYSRAFFPVILVVFLLRSFVVEPFRIPSGSMLPSLHIGDFILVNKFTYGIRLPILNIKLLDVGAPKRGEVMVFRYPHDPSVNYIKRVVGLPGDHIVYEKKKLYINGKLIEQSGAKSYQFEEMGKRHINARRLTEKLDSRPHDILLNGKKAQSRMTFDVPPGQYFVMGDNRDYSNDSRYWGYVDDKLLIGQAFLVWFSWDTANGGGVNWQRIGMLIN